MDVDTFSPFHPQQKCEFFCCHTPNVYFCCSIESNTCFSFVFFIISDYAIVSTGFMVAWGLLVLWLQSFLLQMVMVTLSIITVLAIMCSCHVVSACWGLCIVSEGHNFPVCSFASCCGHSCTCSPALHCGGSCASFCCCQIISSIYPMS